ncbi:MAG TPA: hypothetical protein VMX97_11160, partial [Hyphomicrobiaceae bacterium]|nr:hypothetical protein [Hyphomicrobiaceae bacterium]
PGKKSRFPDGLISGCFGGIPERLFCKDAQGRPRVRHSVLNKDKGAITVGSGRYGPGRTERGKQNNNFARAAKAAVLDTRHKWMYFERRVRAKYGKAKGSRILCALKRDDADGCR